MTDINTIKNMNDCIEYTNRIIKWCHGTIHSQLKCERMRDSYLEFCKINFQSNHSDTSHNSSENKVTCLSVNTLGGNTLNDTTKSPVTSGVLEKPFPLIIFSSRF